MKFRIRSNSTTGRAGGCLGRVFASIFFAVFLAFGVGFCWLMLSDLGEELDRRSWVATPCQIESSRLADSGERESPYRFEVVYRYRWKEREYAGTRWKFQVEEFSDASEVEELVSLYPAGSTGTCQVNPQDPSQAVLSHGSLWLALAALFPLIFVAIGGGGIWFTWFGWKKHDGSGVEEKPRSLSSQAKPGKVSGACVGTGLLGIFLLVGCGLSWFLTVKPLLKMADAQNWPATECRILTSRLQEHRGDDSTTYSIDILYEYTHEGRTYRSNRYDFLSSSGSSSGREGKLEVVSRYRAGSKSTCWVNPAHPTESVLHRGLPQGWWVGLLGPVFAFIGAGGIWLIRRHGRRHSPRLVRDERGRPSESAPRRDPGVSSRPVPSEKWLPRVSSDVSGVTWSPTGARIGRLVAVIFFAAFWNGIVSVFVYQMVDGWRNGSPDYFLTIFLIPFVLIGAGFVGGVLYFFLALFNPRPVLHLNTTLLQPGSVLDLQWEIRGAARRIRRLVFHLEGREEATYRRGTSSYTDKNVFANIELFETDLMMGNPTGSLSLRIPDQAMHSFESSNNRVIWELHVRGEIGFWPDVDERLRLVLIPGETRS